MIGSYVTSLSQELERLWHFGLVTFYFLIHRNRTLFLLAVNQEMKYFAFLLTLKWGLSVSMIIITPLYNPAIPQILTSIIRMIENSIIWKSFSFCIQAPLEWELIPEYWWVSVCVCVCLLPCKKGWGCLFLLVLCLIGLVISIILCNPTIFPVFYVLITYSRQHDILIPTYIGMSSLYQVLNYVCSL